MILLQNNVPSVYYNHSRDFLFIGRLYDVVLNYIKTNSELLSIIAGSSVNDRKFIELYLTTIGFKIKANYNLDLLIAIATIFSYALKLKGTIAAIELVCNAILAATGEASRVLVTVEDNIITIALNSLSLDRHLLNDLLDYILPAGMSVKFINQFILTTTPSTELYKIIDSLIAADTRITTGINGVADLTQDANLQVSMLHTNSITTIEEEG